MLSETLRKRLLLLPLLLFCLGATVAEAQKTITLMPGDKIYSRSIGGIHSRWHVIRTKVDATVQNFTRYQGATSRSDKYIAGLETGFSKVTPVPAGTKSAINQNHMIYIFRVGATAGAKVPFYQLVRGRNFLFDASHAHNPDATAKAPAIVDSSQHLEFQFDTKFGMMWNDQKSGARLNGSFWRPLVSDARLKGFFPVSDYAQPGYADPSGRMWAVLVKERTRGALAKPTGYRQIWNDSKSGARLDGSMWEPIPPAGYVAMGMVAQRGHGMPSLDRVRCVRRDLVAATSAESMIWNDQKSGARGNFSAWSIKVPTAAPGIGYIDAGGFVGVPNYGQPKVAYVFQVSGEYAKSWTKSNGGNLRFDFRSATPNTNSLDLKYISTLSWVWDDTKSGSIFNGAVYSPANIPKGYHRLGYIGFGPGPLPSAVGANTRAVLVARAKANDPTALKAPLDLVWIGDDFESGARTDMSWWYAVPPSGYRALSHVFAPRRGKNSKPPLTSIMCVRNDLCVPAKAGKLLFADRGSRGRHSVSLFEVVPGSEPGLNVGALIAHPGHVRGAPPKLNAAVYTLAAKQTPAQSGLSRSDVDAIIASYGPILHFHPNEKYFTTSVAEYLKDAKQLPGNHLDLRTEASRFGAIARSKSYVMVKQVHANFTDIQFWFFYAHNGKPFIQMQVWASLGRATVDIKRNAGPINCGEHVGDWEHVTLRVANDTKQVVAVGYDSHGDNVWYKPNNSSRNPHISVYSALHMHGCYPATGENLELTAWENKRAVGGSLGNLEIKVFSRNQCAAGGRTFNAYQNYEIVSGDGFTVKPPSWLSTYRAWRWGPKQTNKDTIRFEIKGPAVYPHSQTTEDSGPSTPKFLFQ